MSVILLFITYPYQLNILQRFCFQQVVERKRITFKCSATIFTISPFVSIQTAWTSCDFFTIKDSLRLTTECQFMIPGKYEVNRKLLMVSFACHAFKETEMYLPYNKKICRTFPLITEELSPKVSITHFALNPLITGTLSAVKPR